MKNVTIATAHSSRMESDKGKELTVDLHGGNPYFAYIWIDDVCYSLRKKGNGHIFTINKPK